MSMDSVVPSLIMSHSSAAAPTRIRRSNLRRLQARRESDRQQQVLAALAGWLANTQQHPLLIVDGRMTIHLMNDAAKRVLVRGGALRIDDTTLVLKPEKARRAVERVLHEDMLSMPLLLRVGAAVVSGTVTRLSLQIATLRFAAIELRCVDREACVLRLKETFGVTRAESEIALAIFEGSSLVKISKDRRASVNTIKTQVRHLFQKCRVHSQVALTRRLSDILSVRLPMEND